ncbi:CAAX prenyl protease 1-like [Tropilaelaps mercedesae]|uniref:Ste24 endopeptidase n=1 Tax=Tropilaelaps mercedesae TaxID=418985 RepID=A0A1V9XLZ9_9ACAR|nr:CAAX prenyl protease 1-like [Tropilaelaps mercedesae]
MARCGRPPGRSSTPGSARRHESVTMPSIPVFMPEEHFIGNLSASQIYYLTIGYLWISFLWQTYLLMRQYKVLRNNPVMPLKLKRILDPTYYSKSRAYRLDRVWFAIVQSTLTHFYTICVLHFEITPKLWAHITNFVGGQGFKDAELLVSVAFVSLLLLISGLAALPWDIYATFFIQIKHGITKQSVTCYIREAVKGLFLNQLTTLPMSFGLLYLVKRIGQMSFLYFWMARCILSILRETFYMTLIAPYFQKLYPLPNNRLRSAVESLSTSIGFPLKELYVFEVSQYTTISNAHIAGVFKGKSIILFDTLLKHETVPYDDMPRPKVRFLSLTAIFVSPNLFVREFCCYDESFYNLCRLRSSFLQNPEKKKPLAGSRVQFSRGPKDDSCRTRTTYSRRRFPDEDVLAIVCHEIGHWKMSHIPKLFLISEIDNLLNHLLVGYLYQKPIIFRAFGFYRATPTLIGVVLSAGLLIMPYNAIANFIRTWYKRHCEIQADQFVHRLQQGPFMEKAVITMNMDSLSFPLYDPIYNAWHNSHPPLPQRIEILRGDYNGTSGLSTCHLQTPSPSPLVSRHSRESKAGVPSSASTTKSVMRRSLSMRSSKGGPTMGAKARTANKGLTRSVKSPSPAKSEESKTDDGKK